jgi:hypothetical protein
LTNKPPGPVNQLQSPAWPRPGEGAQRGERGLGVRPNKGRYKAGNKTDRKGYQYGYHVLSFLFFLVAILSLLQKACKEHYGKKLYRYQLVITDYRSNFN